MDSITKTNGTVINVLHEFRGLPTFFDFDRVDFDYYFNLFFDYFDDIPMTIDDYLHKSLFYSIIKSTLILIISI